MQTGWYHLSQASHCTQFKISSVYSDALHSTEEHRSLAKKKQKSLLMVANQAAT